MYSINCVDFPDMSPEEESALNAISEKAFKAAGNPKVPFEYSAYKSDDSDIPIDNLDEIAVEGKVRFIRDRDEFWGGSTSRDYKSPILENPTWLSLCKHVVDSIKKTKDKNHIFFEGIYIVGEEDGVKIAKFLMGS